MAEIEQSTEIRDQREIQNTAIRTNTENRSIRYNNDSYPKTGWMGEAGRLRKARNNANRGNGEIEELDKIHK